MRMPAGRLVSIGAGAVVAVALVSACSNTEATINKRPHPGITTAANLDGVQQVTITTGVDLRFHPSTIVVHPGKVRIVLVNNTGKGVGPPHNLDVSGVPGAFVPLAQSNQKQQATFTAPSPGRYRFVCTIHANQGQTGTLVVTAP
jgi:plastocyanin